jgi:transcriptional regulator with XRE-family HTH domain
MSNLFSDRLRALRGDRKKAEFARLLGVSPPDYQRYENGRMPRADVLSAMSVRLDMTVDQLLSGNISTPTAPTPTPCRYPESCDLERELIQMRNEYGQMRDEWTSVDARLSAMSVQLETVTRLLGVALGNGLSQPKEPRHRAAG